MKRYISVSFAAILCIFTILTASCSNLMQPPSLGGTNAAESSPADPGKGLVVVKIAGAEEISARSLMPVTNPIIYQVEFTKEEIVINKDFGGGLSYVEQELEPGTWDITVRGYLYSQDTGANITVVIGTAVTEVNAGEPVSVSVQLNPFTPGEDDGEEAPGSAGSLSYSIGFPADINSAVLWVYPIPTSAENGVKTINLLSGAAAEGSGMKSQGTLDVPAGYYRLAVYLTRGTTVKESAGTTEIAYVERLQETLAAYTFTGDNFFGIKTFSDIADLDTYLSGQLLNTAASPYTVALNVDLSTLNDNSDGLRKLYQALHQKYINLDLSGSTGDIANSTSSSSSHTNRGQSSNRIVSVIFSDTIGSIGDYAFAVTGASNVPSLVSVDLSRAENLTSIGVNAFSGNTALLSADLSAAENLTSIGNNAFNGCTVVSDFKLPASLTTLGTGAFGGCVRIRFTVEEGGDFSAHGNGTLLIRTSGPAKTLVTAPSAVNIVIPEGVTELNSGVFNTAVLTSVEIPVSLETIGASAFASYYSLASVIIPTGSHLRDIGASAFGLCKSLVTIDLTKAAELETIGSGAFNNCIILTSIDLSAAAALTSIGSSAFNRSSCLSSIEINAPLLVTIGASAFAATPLGSIDLSASTGLTTIDANVFNGCSLLQNAVLPDSISTIGNLAFNGCLSLETITLPYTANINITAFTGCSLVRYIFTGAPPDFSGDYKTLYDGKVLLKKNADLTTYTLLTSSAGGIVDLSGETSITAIQASAFKGSGAVLIKLPNSVTSIGNMAFYGCQNLESVIFPASITTLGTSTLSYCASLDAITLPEGLTAIPSSTFTESPSLKTVVLPSTMTTINGNVFTGCASLESLTLPAAVTSISTLTEFLKSPNLKFTVTGTGTFSASSDHKMLLKDSGATLVLYPSATGAVTLPADITKIDQNAFTGVQGLRSITAPGVTNIAGNAFQNCTSLESADFPELTTVANYAFDGCTALESVSLPQLTAINNTYLFRNCEALKTLVIPDTVAGTIGNYAFFNCKSLESISLTLISALGTYTFAGCSSLESVNLPGLLGVANYAFQNCTSLESISLPAANATIGTYSFSGCTALESVNLPLADIIDAYAFQNCTSLEYLSLPKARSVRGNAILGSGLQSLTMNNVTTINIERALYGCAALKTVRIEKPLTTIGISVFRECPSLTAIILESTAVPPAIDIRAQYGSFDASASFTVYVPDAAAKAAFEASSDWNSFTEISIKTLADL
jgi:hypothetical protein